MMTHIDRMFAAYVTCALWSTNDESDDRGGEPLDKNYSSADIAPKSLAQMRADVERFAKENEAIIRGSMVRVADVWERAGHDFWLTRNGHGAGFWDGDWPEPQATALTAASEAFGETNLIIGDDGQIHTA